MLENYFWYKLATIDGTNVTIIVDLEMTKYNIWQCHNRQEFFVFSRKQMNLD